MKTIKFVRDADSSNSYYANSPYVIIDTRDHSGEYVRAEYAADLIDAAKMALKILDIKIIEGERLDSIANFLRDAIRKVDSPADGE